MVWSTKGRKEKGRWHRAFNTKALQTLVPTRVVYTRLLHRLHIFVERYR